MKETQQRGVPQSLQPVVDMLGDYGIPINQVGKALKTDESNGRGNARVRLTTKPMLEGFRQVSAAAFVLPRNVISMTTEQVAVTECLSSAMPRLFVRALTDDGNKDTAVYIAPHLAALRVRGALWAIVEEEMEAEPPTKPVSIAANLIAQSAAEVGRQDT